MSLADAPDRLHGVLDDLRATWDDVPVAVESETISESQVDPDAEPSFRYASAWVRRGDAVLLVQPVGDDGWVAPGGTWEPGESLATTARREVREETGLAVDLVGVREAIATRHELVGYDHGPQWSLGVVFDARDAGGDLERQASEVDACRWFESVPDPEDLVLERASRYPEPGVDDA
jgi:8-oxo-dGTP pyrophosphatase MutT (NUDIX family)